MSGSVLNLVQGWDGRRPSNSGHGVCLCVCRMCALSQCRDMCCTHRIQLGYSDQWYFISEHYRNRVSHTHQIIVNH